LNQQHVEATLPPYLPANETRLLIKRNRGHNIDVLTAAHGNAPEGAISEALKFAVKTLMPKVHTDEQF
jgi:hypothetical protein